MLAAEFDDLSPNAQGNLFGDYRAGVPPAIRAKYSAWDGRPASRMFSVMLRQNVSALPHIQFECNSTFLFYLFRPITSTLGNPSQYYGSVLLARGESGNWLRLAGEVDHALAKKPRLFPRLSPTILGNLLTGPPHTFDPSPPLSIAQLLLRINLHII